MRPRRLGRGLHDLGLARPRPAPLPVPFPEVTPAPVPPIVCVTSGKGGTGKSVITSNLAVHLAAEGLSVLAVDADLGLANLHLLLGLPSSSGLLDVVERGVPLTRVTASGPLGVRLAAGGSGLTELADLHPTRLLRLVRAMEEVGADADVVLVDTGAGIGRATTAFLYAIRDIVVVITADVTAMTDGYAVIKNVARNNRSARIGVIVNRVGSAVEGLEVFGRIDQVSRRFLERPLTFMGHVLEDRRVGASVASRIPILLNQPAAPAAACLRGVARSLRLELLPRPAPAAPRAWPVPPEAAN